MCRGCEDSRQGNISIFCVACCCWSNRCFHHDLWNPQLPLKIDWCCWIPKDAQRETQWVQRWIDTNQQPRANRIHWGWWHKLVLESDSVYLVIHDSSPSIWYLLRNSQLYAFLQGSVAFISNLGRQQRELRKKWSPWPKLKASDLRNSLFKKISYCLQQ